MRIDAAWTPGCSVSLVDLNLFDQHISAADRLSSDRDDDAEGKRSGANDKSVLMSGSPQKDVRWRVDGSKGVTAP